MIECCSWGQISEIKQYYQVGTLAHSENWFLISKREKGITELPKGHFFETRRRILLGIRYPFFD